MSALNMHASTDSFPYRIALAGGWIDQPWVSRICAGSMVVVSIHPTDEFHERSGLATSSRRVALKLWGGELPPGDPVRMARLLFGAENPPGSAYVSGSQDHIGLLVPGISRLDYAGRYWPESIVSTRDPAVCRWLERVLHMIPLKPRPPGYDPLAEKNLSLCWIRRLGESGRRCYASILNRDAQGLGESLSLSLESWSRILPQTYPDSVRREIEALPRGIGGILSGAGGGYLLVVSEEPVEGALHIRIRR